MEFERSVVGMIVFLVCFIVIGYVTVVVLSYMPDYTVFFLVLLYALAFSFVGVILYFIHGKSKERAELEKYYKWRKQYKFEGAGARESTRAWEEWQKRYRR